MVPTPIAGTDPLLVAAASAVLSGGVVSAVAAFVRARPQAQLDVVNAAKILYDELRKELDETRKELQQTRNDLQTALQHADDCELRLDRLERALHRRGMSVAELLDPT